MKKICFYQTSIGKIGIAEKEGFITNVYLPVDLEGNRGQMSTKWHSCPDFDFKAYPVTSVPAEKALEAHNIQVEETSLIREAAGQLEAYLSGRLRTFSLPLSPAGTKFMQRVWEELLNIPYGRTRTYGQIAEIIGAPKAARAVGLASHRNPIPIIIPCHRVIGSDGKMTGYRGGLELKRLLLELEGIFYKE